jgi:hypothetical protein
MSTESCIMDLFQYIELELMICGYVYVILE